ncbi:MAG: hypothetical protein FD147_184 [Chloroflexi bacterium]|nr:MAG: hypothetical protein FD147_184 [Chloroflexota bacterium]
MPTAELIVIGTELLLGEINDTNTRYLARQLRDCGIDLFRSTTVGDNVQRITALMQEALLRADIVISSGGLGPTVDDPTREAAALAFGTHNEFHPELWFQLRQRFQKRGLTISENNKKQAYIPCGATVVENPVGTAPAFILSSNEKTLICLPGVPREMETLVQLSVIPWLKTHFQSSGTIKAKVLHTSGVAESRVDELIGDLERMKNPTVGLLAHPGIVDIRITAKAESAQAADKMIEKVESQIRKRLGKDIYGEDGETLASAIQHITEQVRYPIKIIICGFGSNAFTDLIHPKIKIETLETKDFESAINQVNIAGDNKDHFIFTCKYTSHIDIAKIELGFFSEGNPMLSSRDYPGATELWEEWAKNFSFSFIRQQLILKVVSRGDS